MQIQIKPNRTEIAQNRSEPNRDPRKKENEQSRDPRKKENKQSRDPRMKENKQSRDPSKTGPKFKVPNPPPRATTL